MQNLYKDLEKLLLAHDAFKSEEGKILKNKVTESAISNDKSLVTQLLKNLKLKEHFFDDIEKGVLVFDREKFVRFINNKEFLPNSYTSFANKIGLHNGEEYVESSDRVSLVWPYKDCVLEGGQDKEDQKRSEIFYNETLAPDEIDRLFEKKALTGFNKYDEKGSTPIKSLSGDENLIIKGNNLLALHSLKKKYAGRVKLIYIDPPYNTGSDGFGYNDKFNHSTWLTFMKNRLEVAKQLLRPDGVIFVHIDYIESAYLKVLMDEIFGADKALPAVTMKTATPAGFKVVNPGFINVSEQLLVYAKGEKNVIKEGYTKTKYQKDYSKYIKDKNKPAKNWEIINIADAALQAAGYKNKTEFKETVGNEAAPVVLNKLVSDFALNNADSVFATYGPHKPSTTLQKAIEKSKQEPATIIDTKKEDGESYYLLNGRLLAFYSAKLKEVDGEIVPTQRLTDFWSDLSWDSLSGEGGVTLKNGKKPERLLKRIIELTTEKDDLVLDYHLGSGTTAAVAHKLGRKYIGIEQLDYGDNDSVKRLENVIAGDASGISKIVDWKGGGSFVYAELMELNQAFINDIEKADTSAKLEKIYKKMQSEAFFRYEVDVKKFDIKEFSKLSLADQKQVLLECLDKNHLYVNYSEIDDATYKVSAEDKKLNKLFYGE